MTPPTLTKTGRCSECGRRQTRQETDGWGQVIDIADPCIHFRAPKLPGVPVQWPPTSRKSEPENAMKIGAEDLKAELRSILREQPMIQQSSARRLVEERTGCDPINPGTFHGHWNRVREELRDAAPHRATVPEVPAPSAPAEPTERSATTEEAADVAFSEAVHGNGEGKPLAGLSQRSRFSDILEEARSLRATYESDQFTRLEEQDGVWVLRVNLEFPNRIEAMKALAGLGGWVTT